MELNSIHHLCVYIYFFVASSELKVTRDSVCPTNPKIFVIHKTKKFDSPVLSYMINIPFSTESS